MIRFLAAALMMLAATAHAETRLIMFDQAGCSWCAAWTKDVGTEYPLTEEGRTAPLHRQDISAPLPDGIALASKPVFTPTFVLVHDGEEVGRIEGYPGEDFFWGLLAGLIDRLPAGGAPEPEA